MNEHEQIELLKAGQLMWEVIAEQGFTDKQSALSYVNSDLGDKDSCRLLDDTRAYCAGCEIDGAGPDSGECMSCPLWDRETEDVCVSANFGSTNAFMIWENNSSAKSKQKAALEIVERHKSAIKKLEN